MTDKFHPAWRDWAASPETGPDVGRSAPGRGRSPLGSKTRQKVKRRLRERDGTFCYLCGRWQPYDLLTIDHKTPRSRGGTNSIHNLGLTCFPCNNEKADMTAEEYLALRSSRDMDTTER